MSDDATKTVEVDVPTTTEVPADPSTVAQSEDATVSNDTVENEGDVKTESHNEHDEDKDVKPKADEDKESLGLLKTSAKHNYSNPRNNKKFDPSLAPVTDDPAKMASQIRTQV